MLLTETRRPPSGTGTQGIAVTLAELIAARPEARRLGLGAGAHGLTAGAGGHPSRLRGPGVAYAESRPYVPGDDPRAMDWRVTARAARPHIKVYQEERERPVWLVVDQGRSMQFGTRVAFKSVIAARAAALLAWGALAHGDRVGGLVLAGNARHWQPPARRERGVLGLLRALAQTPAVLAATPGFTTALDTLQRPAPSGATTASGAASGAASARPAARALVQPGSLVFLISDFADLLPNAAAWLTRLADHSTVVLILVYDPLEAAAPNADQALAGTPWPVTDGHAGLLLDLDSAGRRAHYSARFQRRREALLALARRHGAHCLTLSTERPVGPSLALALGGRPKPTVSPGGSAQPATTPAE